MGSFSPSLSGIVSWNSRLVGAVLGVSAGGVISPLRIRGVYAGALALSVVVSVRVPRWVKKILEEHGVNVSEYVREVLVRRAEELREEELRRMLREVAGALRGRVDPAEWARIIEEDRGSR